MTIIPQIGPEARSEVVFSINQQPALDLCPDLKERLNSLWTSLKTDSIQVDLPLVNKTTEKLSYSPITAGFNRPIGYLWSTTSNERAADALARLSFVSRELAITARAEKVSFALRELAQPLEAISGREPGAAIASACRRALACSAVVVWELRPLSSKNLKTVAAVNSKGDNLELDMKVGQGVAGRSAQDCATIVIDDLLDSAELEAKNIQRTHHIGVVREHKWRSGLFTPLDIGGEVAGVIAAYATRPREFSTIDENILRSFAQRLSAGLTHRRRMNDLLEMEKKLSVAAPAVEAGRLASENAHDIKHELQRANNTLSSLGEILKSLGAEDAIDILNAASAQIRNASRVINEIVNDATLGEPKPEKIPLKEFFGNTIQKLAPDLEGSGIEVTIDCPPTLGVRADRTQLQRVLLNFLNNALWFLARDQKKGQKEIRIVAQEQDDKLIMSILDNGPGIEEKDQPKVFDFLYTTKGDQGLGFGLAIVKRIIEKHGGSVVVTSRWGYYSDFIVSLPGSRIFHIK